MKLLLDENIPAALGRAVVQALLAHNDELVGAFVVIDARNVRVRRRPTQG